MAKAQQGGPLPPGIRTVADELAGEVEASLKRSHLRDKGLGIGFTCRVLELSESAYCARKKRPKSARRLQDEQLMPLIEEIHTESGGTYGLRRISRALRCKGVAVARGTVERLMRELGLEGVIRGQRRRTTVPEPLAPRPPDLVDRDLGRDAGGNGARGDDDCGNRALRLLIGCPERVPGCQRDGPAAADLLPTSQALQSPRSSRHGMTTAPALGARRDLVSLGLSLRRLADTNTDNPDRQVQLSFRG
ncbi:IS3 family transposase [Streptomyces sp. ME19-01-6]|uniref:IS3 family transposase n=1 Tax=Streptomyces sp. ME19-01-6 TaxID=3028686 RepID=UPI0029AAEE16|nr:IS3 family transposase [Streptomyces sp. ME19-01-6]MDX3229044.1 IS3 family transposase [Streptomyces sp. ME19-01-6]